MEEAQIYDPRDIKVFPIKEKVYQNPNLLVEVNLKCFQKEQNGRITDSFTAHLGFFYVGLESGPMFYLGTVKPQVSLLVLGEGIYHVMNLERKTCPI